MKLVTGQTDHNRKEKSSGGWPDAILWAIAVLLIVLINCGFRLTINYTGSIPEGLYYVQNEKPQKGDYTLVTSAKVLRQAKQRGYIAPETLIGKRIIAGAGDTVCIRKKGVFVSGHRVPRSRPLARDSRGRPMPKLRGCMSLSGHQVFVMGEEAKSFDSRYFGPITHYKQTLIPLLTF